MALPSTDMMLLLYLVPESAQTKEPVATLVRCAVHLETAKFVEFWEVRGVHTASTGPTPATTPAPTPTPPPTPTHVRARAYTYALALALALAHARAYSLQNPLSRTTTRSHSARTPPQVANLGGNELLDAVSGFDEAIRSYMIGVLSITFQKVEVRRTA